MRAHAVTQYCLIGCTRSERIAAAIFEEPVGCLTVPHQGMAVEGQIVSLREFHKLGRFGVQTELTGRVVPGLGLHVVLRCDLVEVEREQFRGRASQLGASHRHTPREWNGVKWWRQTLAGHGVTEGCS